jgi:hypothetical protein
LITHSSHVDHHLAGYFLRQCSADVRDHG